MSDSLVDGFFNDFEYVSRERYADNSVHQDSYQEAYLQELAGDAHDIKLALLMFYGLGHALAMRWRVDGGKAKVE